MSKKVQMTKRIEPFSAYGKWARQGDLHIEKVDAEEERRRQIGLTIDPATAETTFWWADTLDPYSLRDSRYFPEGYQVSFGRVQFARHPGASGDDWVEFCDLPEATRNALWDRARQKLRKIKMIFSPIAPNDDVVLYLEDGAVVSREGSCKDDDEGSAVLYLEDGTAVMSCSGSWEALERWAVSVSERTERNNGGGRF